MTNSKYFTEEEMLQYVGERCPDFDPGCCACREWAKFDLIKYQYNYGDDYQKAYLEDIVRVFEYEAENTRRDADIGDVAMPVVKDSVQEDIEAVGSLTDKERAFVEQHTLMHKLFEKAVTGVTTEQEEIYRDAPWLRNAWDGYEEVAAPVARKWWQIWKRG